MALRQLVPIEITLLGDGAATTFTFPVANLVPNGLGGSGSPVAAGVVPNAVIIPNPPITLTGSPTIDANGNISFTFTAAPTNNQQYSFEVDLIFNSGAITSTSPTPGNFVSDVAGMVGTVPGTAPAKTLVTGGIYNTAAPTPSTGQTLPFQLDASGNLNVNVKAGSSGNAAASATGSAVPASADYQGINVGGTLRGLTGFGVGSQFASATAIVDASGNQIVSFGGNPATANFTNPGLTQTAAVQLSTDLLGNLRVRNRAETSLGDLTAMPRQNQIEVNFSQGFVSAAVANTTTGTGTATTSNGQAVYASGTTSGGRSTGVSVGVLSYRPGHEWYAYFSALFSTGGTGTGFQRIGPYSTTDGFYLSYEGATVNFTQRQNSVDTHVARGSWNGDAATGAAGSRFTSGGSPVALNFQTLNIFRVRGAWFGASPISLEVFSPDGVWVTLHTFLFPNTLTTPFIYTTNMPITCDVQSNSATAVSISTPCWAMGVVNAVVGGTFNSNAATWNSSTTLNTAVNIPQASLINTIGINLIQTTPITGGIVNFEGSIDGTNWFPISVICVNQQTVQTSYTLQSSTTISFVADITAWAYFRIRLAQVISGAGTLQIQTGTDPGNASIDQVFGNVTISNMPAIAANNSAPPFYSMLIGGYDGTTNAHFILTDTSGRLITVGNLTNNNAAPTATNYGVLPAVATTAAPSYTTGNQVTLSTDLAGNLRTNCVNPDTVGATAALNALNAAATINAQGDLAVGGFLAAGTLIGTIVAECSFDGGTTWVATYFDTGNKPSSIVFGSANTATSFSLIGQAGASNYRVRVSVFTSGTANCTLRGNDIHDPTLLFTGTPASTTQPPTTAQMGGWVTTAAPAYSTTTLNVLSLTTAGGLRTDNSSWGGTALGTPTNFGTTPGAVIAASVNASLFQGTTAVGAAAPLQVSLANTGANGTAITVSMTSTTITGTVAVTQSTSPWVVNATQVAGTTLGTPQTFGTAPTGVVIGTSSDLYVAGTRARSNQTTTAAGVVDTNITGIIGVTAVAAAAGILKVGISGGTGATLDAASSQNVAAPTNGILILGEFNTTPTTISSGNVSPLQLTAAGGVRVGITGNASATLDAAINTGAAPTNVIWDTPAPAQGLAAASLTPVSMTSTAQLVVKASAGTLYGLQFVSLNVTTTSGGVLYIHFFNTTTTTGLATTSWVGMIPIPAPSSASTSASLSIAPGSFGLMNFTTGITVVVSTTSTSNTTAGGTGVVGVFFIK